MWNIIIEIFINVMEKLLAASTLVFRFQIPQN